MARVRSTGEDACAHAGYSAVSCWVLQHASTRKTHWGLMYRFFCTLGIALLIAGPGFSSDELPTAKPEDQGFSSERLERITKMTQAYVDEGQLAGVVTMVARHGKVVHFEAVGHKGADDKRPLELDDLFRIYSMSKPITAAAVMQLYEQGKFHLSDPVTKFVPEFKELKVLGEDGELVPVEREMTMQHLLTHTAGFSYGFNPQGDPVDAEYAKADIWQAKDLDEFAQKVAQLPLKFQPGDQWHYSIAVDITGLIVQRISGMSFDEYLQKNIFDPLGMTDTFFAVPKDKMERLLPNHYINPGTQKLTQMPEGGTAAMQDYANVTLFSGGGGLVSSTTDYMRFAETMRNGGRLGDARLLSPKTVKFMSTNHLPSSIAAGGNGEQPTLDAQLRGFGFGPRLWPSH